MNFKTLTTLVAISIFFLENTMAQKPLMKLGKIDIKNLKMTHYAKDSSVSALVLFDYGNAKMQYSQKGSFQVVFDHHIRIKIFNKDGYEWADAQEYLYHDGATKEKLSQLKGFTYNLEGGKVVKTKLSSKSIFEEKDNDNRDIQKFTMPNVKEGSIIEYSYKIVSDFTFNFHEWEFQKSIPVAWSEFNTAIPEYYYYQKVFQGYLPFEENTRNALDKTFTLTTTSSGRDISVSSLNTSGDSERATTSSSQIKYVENIERWVVKDAPAFVEEPYMTTYRNYISKIKFELATRQFPRQRLENIMGTWQKLNEQFLKNDYFGAKVAGSGFLKKEVETILAGESDDNIKISKIYNFVKKNISWDGRYRKYLDFNLKDPFNAKKGSSAEVNLILTSMLQKAGFRADPVLISTRDNGIVRQDLPISNQFNYVICKLSIEGKYILLDATDPYLPMDILPEICLNGQGWAVAEVGSGWVDLGSNTKAKSQISGNLTVSDGGVLSGELTKKYDGYYSRSPRKKFLQNGEDKFVTDKIADSSWEIEELSFENAESLSSPFIQKYTIEEMGGAENLGGTIYLNPVVSENWNKNPFKLKERAYPVDFAYPRGQKYYVTFTMPEGYTVEETPESVALTLPDNAAKFVFNTNVNGNQIVVLCTLDINRAIFGQMEYQNLKEFFAQIVAKQKEQIVLKKA